MENEKMFNKEEVSDIIYCLKMRKETLQNKIRFFNEVIKDNSGRRLDILQNSIYGYDKEINSLELLILKLQNLL